MNVADLQLQLHKAIDTITDSDKLVAIYTLLQKTNGPHHPMSIEEYTNAINESREQIKKGDFLSVEDFEKESENW